MSPYYRKKPEADPTPELVPVIADKFLQGNARRVFGLQALATGAQAVFQGA